MTTMTKTDLTEDLSEARATIDRQTREIEKLKAELAKTTTDLETTTGKLRTATTAYRLHDSVRNGGVFAGAVPDVASQAASAGAWEPDSKGVLRLRDPATGTLGKSIDKWLTDLKEAKGFYFEDYSGEVSKTSAGADIARQDGKQDKTASVRIDGVTYSYDDLLTIFHPKTMNLTLAMQAEKENPQLVERIAKQVGNKIFTGELTNNKRVGL